MMRAMGTKAAEAARRAEADALGRALDALEASLGAPAARKPDGTAPGSSPEGSGTPPAGTPPEVVNVLKVAAARTMQEASLREVMEKQNFSTDTYEDQATFQASMARESAYIKNIASTGELKK